MTKKLTFEQSIEKVETIISKLQSGQIDLDDSIDEFKIGLDLINNAQERLNQANLKIQKIVKENSKIQLEDMQ
jgi:exodeoxyribonuclease VII small subunit